MKCVDLFAGCGGMSLGFQNAGIELVVAYDNWEPAIKVYEANFPHEIKKINLADEAQVCEDLNQREFNMIIGGPPCQDFSSAGKRDINGGKADLTYHFTNIVCSAKPEWFVMENVEQIKKSPVLKDVVEQFLEAGYGLTSVILDASYCNVPQSRVRFFLIGHFGDKNNQLLPIIEKNQSSKPMTIRDYLGDSLGVEYYYRHPRNYSRRGIFSIDEPSPTVRGVNRPVPKGYQLNSCDPQCVQLKDVRPLTTLQRSYLQTFPHDFIFLGTKTDLEQMIGNAVPVNLATFIANCILEYIMCGNTVPTLFDFDEPFILPERKLTAI